MCRINQEADSWHNTRPCFIWKNDLKTDENSNEYSTFELLDCNLKYGNQFYKFMAIYQSTHDNQNDVNLHQYLEEFEKFVFGKSVHPGFVLNDFNIHIIDVNDCTTTDSLCMVESFNLTQLVSVPIYMKGNIFCHVFNWSCDVSVNEIWVENSHISDHYRVTFAMKTKNPKQVKKNSWVQEFERHWAEQFRKDITYQGITTLVNNESQWKKTLMSSTKYS